MAFLTQSNAVFFSGFAVSAFIDNMMNLETSVRELLSAHETFIVLTFLYLFLPRVLGLAFLPRHLAPPLPLVSR
jgi:hypothetical protein